MKNLIYLFLIGFPACLLAQGGIVNEGMNINITTGTEFRVENGGVTNSQNGAINNEGNLYLDNDWTQSGASTLYSGNGWMWFEGSMSQNLTSTNLVTVPKLRVDNGNLLILGTNVEVTNSLDLMNNGNVELGTYNLVIASGATISNYDASNHIITNSTGVLQQEVAATDVVFPVGNSSYNPATLNNAGTTDDFLIRVEDQVLESGTSGAAETQDVVNRTWHIDEATIGGSNATVTLQWETADELTGFDRMDCGVIYWDGAAWDYPGYTAAVAAGAAFTQSRSGLTDFSPFTVSSSPLSSTHSVANQGGTILLYPNPAHNHLIVDFSDWSGKSERVDIQIIDVLGRVLFTQQANVLNEAKVELEQVQELVPGHYFLRASSEDGLDFVRKFTKAKN